ITSAEDVAFRLVEAAKSSHKTVLASWMGERDTKAARDILENGNVPVYQFPESAVYAFLKMYHYARNLRLLYETPSNTPLEFTPDIRATRALIQKVLDDKRLVFNEIEAKQLMRYYDIPTTHSQLAADPEEVKKVAGKIGFPLVMKIASPDITHKTDVGGVKLKIQSLEEAEAAFFEIMKNVKKNSPKAKIEGVLMEEMVSKRYEILIGAKKDPIFGPIVVFGMGGVATEIFKDHNIGLPPLNMALAERVIEETKIFELLKGFRKVPAVDLKAIQFLLYKFAYLLMEFPEIREIDLNPFVVDETGGMVIDANIVLDGELAGKKIKPYSHLVISPYPKQYCKTISLKDGRTVMLRPIRPEDEPLEAELFSNLSKESIYFRFFGYVPKVTHELLTRFTQIDYDREMAIVAELEEGGHKKFAGVVRLVSETLNNTAEFAIVVADPWQGQGLG
ncbi:MAG TPA: acetate--CoA ligase family protein, partial [Saprospiraceae bacterium]|nr:acetate--CoA ligase family protein [Saprospiraceae bacterium]